MQTTLIYTSPTHMKGSRRAGHSRPTHALYRQLPSWLRSRPKHRGAKGPRLSSDVEAFKSSDVNKLTKSKDRPLRANCCITSGREKFVGSSVRVAARAGDHGWKGNLSDVTSLSAVCSSALGKTEGSAPGFLAVSAPGGGLVPVLAGYPFEADDQE